MKTWHKYLLLLLSIFGAAFAILTILKRGEEKILGLSYFLNPTPTPSPSPSPSPTPSPSPSPSPTLTPTPTPSPTPTPKLPPPVTPQQIHSFIERFAAQYGVDPNVLRHIAVCESGFNPLAVNGPYVGLYQFGKFSWISNRQAIGEDTNLDLRLSAEESAQTAAYVVSIGKRTLWPNCYP